MMTMAIYPCTAEKATSLRANLSICGANNARVRVMRNGSARVVLASVSDRDAARDALVLSSACTATGNSFTSPASTNAWNGPVEIFIRFLAP